MFVSRTDGGPQSQDNETGRDGAGSGQKVECNSRHRPKENSTEKGTRSVPLRHCSQNQTSFCRSFRDLLYKDARAFSLPIHALAADRPEPSKLGNGLKKSRLGRPRTSVLLLTLQKKISLMAF
jgi:hypothetical protein